MSHLSEDLFVDKDPEWLKQGGLHCFMAACVSQAAQLMALHFCSIGSEY